MNDAPRLTVLDVRLYERPVRLRLPFRFGVITLTEAPQAFARVLVQGEDGREAWGASAEMLVPKWFDKSPDLSNAENIDHLRRAAHNAARLYGDAGPHSAWGLFAASYESHVATCAKAGMNGLVAGFGTALLDRAVLDALCRLAGCSVFDAVRANLPGLEWDGLDMPGFVAARPVPATIAIRHTIGMVDPLDDDDRTPETDVGDGLPVTLEEAIAAYGNRHFKITVSDDVDAAVARLERVAAILDCLDDYAVTIDGGEQFTDIEGVAALWQAIAASPRLDRFRRAIEFLEQPLHRAVTFEQDIAAAGVACPVIIDEADGDFGAFPRARDLGYRGVSYKGCKGIYKGLINAARCAAWNAEAGEERFFMTAEDLTTQAGICLQQDTAMAALVGVEHVQRNGHHYANGMAGVPEKEAATFLDAHPDLYHRSDGVVRLAIDQGKVSLASLNCPGFAVAAEPDWDTMAE